MKTYQKHFLSNTTVENDMCVPFTQNKEGVFFQINRSDDGTTTTFSLTHSQPESFYLIVVISAPAALLLLLDYVLSIFLFV